MLNVISTCRDILCVDINVDKRCVDHSSSLDDAVLTYCTLYTLTILPRLLVSFYVRRGIQCREKEQKTRQLQNIYACTSPPLYLWY